MSRNRHRRTPVHFRDLRAPFRERNGNAFFLLLPATTSLCLLLCARVCFAAAGVGDSSCSDCWLLFEGNAVILGVTSASLLVLLDVVHDDDGGDDRGPPQRPPSPVAVVVVVCFCFLSHFSRRAAQQLQALLLLLQLLPTAQEPRVAVALPPRC